MTPWLTAIFGAALIGLAVHGLNERSTPMTEDTDGLNRQQRQRQAALIAAREVVAGLRAPDELTAADLIVFAEYIRAGVTPAASAKTFPDLDHLSREELVGEVSALRHTLNVRRDEREGAT